MKVKTTIENKTSWKLIVILNILRDKKIEDKCFKRKKIYYKHWFNL